MAAEGEEAPPLEGEAAEPAEEQPAPAEEAAVEEPADADAGAADAEAAPAAEAEGEAAAPVEESAAEPPAAEPPAAESPGIAADSPPPQDQTILADQTTAPPAADQTTPPPQMAESVPGTTPSPEVDDSEGLEPHIAENRMVSAYIDLTSRSGKQVNHLVERSLLESAERFQRAGGETFWVEAPGNHPLVFSNRLDDADMKIFAQVFEPPMPFMVRLDLSYNLLTDAGVETLCSSLLGPRGKRLKSCVLRGNSIGPKGVDMLCQSLRSCKQLLRFDISHNPIEQIGGLMLVDFLQRTDSLQELLLANTEIDIDVLVALSAVLLTGSARAMLKVCDIENPRIRTLQQEHIVHLGRMLRVNTYLSEIYLGKHRMRDDGVRQLVSFLLENKTLRLLDLRCNEIGADGAKHLGTLLQSDCQLLQLNLSGNRIGERDNVEGAKALAKALFSNRMLNHLDLNHNELCGEALQLIATSADKNSTLESIALFHNKWDQNSALKFHDILGDRGRIMPLVADFTTAEAQDLRIDVCKNHEFAIGVR
eukprot:gnl/TRDRNA2_/TRDRNA2_184817_c0_seq1.p1 gnl/TRDRNA2_/TRDRNA2_184817_c0~~gnl/TRDRNA2_/TRDRNA2_184817_c0_seq1.p1  ORF type:complete len:555 (+),score=129.41 gnl/TRDRNA2_/TRDRNA2_184817_c0_seq1:59-1666(+)